MEVSDLSNTYCYSTSCHLIIIFLFLNEILAVSIPTTHAHNIVFICTFFMYFIKVTVKLALPPVTTLMSLYPLFVTMYSKFNSRCNVISREVNKYTTTTSKSFHS